MKRIEIFDPAMCCPTGLCGPNINPDLMRIAAVLETLKRRGSLSSVIIYGTSRSFMSAIKRLTII